MRIFRGKRTIDPQRSAPLRLVVGLNQVDQMVDGGWDVRLNLPTDAAELEIQRKCEDIIRRLSAATKINSRHIEYYSALKRYRLDELLVRVIENSYAGFKLAQIKPAPYWEVDGVDPAVALHIEQELARRATSSQASQMPSSEKLLKDLRTVLSEEDLERLESAFTAEQQVVPKVAVLGQRGVGKTTTVNALFATDWVTNPVEVGTQSAQDKTVQLASGDTITIVDLPGYGRSIKEDAEYERIYQDVVLGCDLLLLIIQADRGDLADDVEMIIKLNNWLTKSAASLR